MIHKLGHTSELATVAITDLKLLDYIRAGLTALDDNYGADRDIDEDDGGYIIYCERGTTHPDLLMMIDYEESICEYTTEINGTDYITSMYILNNDFVIQIVISRDDAPQEMLDCLA